MITFDPPELKDEFARTVRALYDFAEITFKDCPDWHSDDFSFDEDPDDTVITADSVFSFEVGADDDPEFTVAELIELAKELPRSRLVDLRYYVGPSRAYVRIEPKSDAAYQFVNHLQTYDPPIRRRFATSLGEMTLALVNGFTPFAILLFKDGEYESDSYPTFHGDDLFIEVAFPAGTTDETWLAAVPAFLFELDEQTALAFGPAPRGAYADMWPEEYDEDTYLERLDAIRLRPLIGGPGVPSLLRLYERAIGRDGDPEQHFVGFVKVMEYVSATVVNTERNAQLRRRLLSPRALSPDAGFIRDLGLLFESLRNFKKDAEALRLTIEACCDPVELARVAPPHQRALGAITEMSTPAERKKALDAFSATLSATRNMFSHAKANYTQTGDECPEPELNLLIKCARLAAQQCARWFAHSDVSLRIVD